MTWKDLVWLVASRVTVAPRAAAARAERAAVAVGLEFARSRF